MGKEYEYDSKVIKPPVESMSGKVIKPSMRELLKNIDRKLDKGGK